ncbi:MAG: hypothetical protein R3A44_02455 [Caldilineaceae bacterium]
MHHIVLDGWSFGLWREAGAVLIERMLGAAQSAAADSICGLCKS